MRIHNNLPKVRAALYLPEDLLDEARNAVNHLAGNPVRLTLTKLAESALRDTLQELKDRYNDGADFPPRPEDLKGGRPIAARTPNMLQTTCSPRPDAAPESTQVGSKKDELRQKLLEMIRRNESMRRETQK